MWVATRRLRRELIAAGAVAALRDAMLRARVLAAMNDAEKTT
jgi:hypothetical protein